MANSNSNNHASNLQSTDALPNLDERVAIALAASWSFLALICWSRAAFNNAQAPSSAHWDSATLTMLAVLSAAFTLGYRSWILRHETASRIPAKPLLGLLAGFAAVNWIGFSLLSAESIFAAGPAVCIFAAAELGGWLWLAEIPTSKVIATPNNTSANATDRSSDIASQPKSPTPLATPAPPELQPASEINLAEPEEDADDLAAIDTSLEARLLALAPSHQPASDELERTESESPNQLNRKVEDRTDASGERILSGEIRIRLSPGQKQSDTIVDFQPAFSCPPSVEIECSSETVSARIVNSTPAGMRIQCRRPQTDPAEELLLGWVATQPTGHTASNPALTPLP